MKILKINTAFIKGKNGENDKEIIKVIKLLKPIKKDNNRKIIKKLEINNNINRIKCNSFNSH